MSTPLRTLRYGRALLRLERCASTNDEARAWALAGAPDGATVISAEQTAGRGRAGRGWHSPNSGGLYLSIIARPPLPVSKTLGLSFAAAVAAAEALAPLLPAPPTLKWPNDVFFGDQKLGGILCELSATGERCDFVVIGIGLNLNNDTFPGPLRELATSVALASGRRCDEAEVAAALLSGLEEEVDLLVAAGFEPIRARWRARSYTLGRRVSFLHEGTRRTGTARDLEPDGALLVELDDGAQLRVIAGDVAVLQER